MHSDLDFTDFKKKIAVFITKLQIYTAVNYIVSQESAFRILQDTLFSNTLALTPTDTQRSMLYN